MAQGLLSYDKLRYVLLPGKCPPNAPPQILEFHNNSYKYWKKFWSNVFAQNGTDEVPNPDSYYRQDIVTHILVEQEIVAMHMYSVFNFGSDPAREHSYFTHGFEPSFMKYLADQGSRFVMSIEYMTVDSRWRRSSVGFSFGEVLMGLAVKMQKHLGCDMGVAPSRADVKVTEMCVDVGADVIIKDIQMHNTPVDLIAIKTSNIRRPSNLQVARLTEHLWSKREDLTLALESIPALRAA